MKANDCLLTGTYGRAVAGHVGLQLPDLSFAAVSRQSLETFGAKRGETSERAAGLSESDQRSNTRTAGVQIFGNISKQLKA